MIPERTIAVNELYGGGRDLSCSCSRGIKILPVGLYTSQRVTSAKNNSSSHTSRQFHDDDVESVLHQNRQTNRAGRRTEDKLFGTDSSLIRPNLHVYISLRVVRLRFFVLERLQTAITFR
jgi:hypothetical protein